MKKRLIGLALLLALVMALAPTGMAADVAAIGGKANAEYMTVAAALPTAEPSTSMVLVNGENVSFGAYKINGSNYFKLRDLAYTFNGTAAQFGVDWNREAKAIELTAGAFYVTIGGEMGGSGNGSRLSAPTDAKILLDGSEIWLTAYNIDGNNYFKLRDIGQLFDFGVDWDGASGTVIIDTSKGYDNQAEEEPVVVEPPQYVPSEEEVYEIMTALKTEYPQGMGWTDEEILVIENFTYRGCTAFTKILSDAAFGSLPSRFHNDVDSIKVGDILRLSYTHSVIVLAIEESNVVVAEGNYNYSINWGRKIPLSRLKNLVEPQYKDDNPFVAYWSGGEIDVTIETRYPE